MPPKPHRLVMDRVSGYADEAAAYIRRRRLTRSRSRASTRRAAGARRTCPKPSRARCCSAAARLIDAAR